MMALTILFLLSFASPIIVHNLPTVVADHVALNSETDKLALLDLKEKLTKGEPHALPSWNESHFCEWQGVMCSRRHMRVSALHLENQNLGGTLGPALGNLTFLKLILLSSNNLKGEIPSQIGRLKRLQVLGLSNNTLHGQIPIQLTNCTSLQEISLSHNKLTGIVPSWFGSMMQLSDLHLDGNDLVGTIPSSLGNLSSFVRISLARNHLDGSIPHELGRLSNLTVLNLGDNNLSEYGAGGPISPEGDIYSYGILLLEMLTGKKPTDSMFSEGLSLHMFCKMEIPERITDIVDSLLLIPIAEESRVVMQQQNIKECLVSLVRIGVACSEEFPAQRMDIKNVIVELNAIKQKFPCYC